MSLFGSLFADGEPKLEVVDVQKRFDLISRVGQGSMSRVWRADDQINRRFVALKVLDKEKTERFERRFKDIDKPSEGEIALSLKHPHIVETYEIGFTPEHELFLVMEYVDGAGLSLLVDLQNEQMRQYRTRFMIQIGEALSYFHQKGWIHRDICPRNIMVDDHNNIKLIDFGLTVPDKPDFRKPGNRTGTANYMAPELIKRKPTDQRIDVFSYAVTCFEMYTKRHPWDAAMTIDAVLHHINKPPLELTELVPKVDSEIAAVIMKGLASDPGDRWGTIAEMVAEFRRIERRLVQETRKLLKARKKSEKQAPADPPQAVEDDAAAGSQQDPESVTPQQAADTQDVTEPTTPSSEDIPANSEKTPDAEEDEEPELSID